MEKGEEMMVVAAAGVKEAEDEEGEGGIQKEVEEVARRRSCASEVWTEEGRA